MRRACVKNRCDAVLGGGVFYGALLGVQSETPIVICIVFFFNAFVRRFLFDSYHIDISSSVLKLLMPRSNKNFVSLRYRSTVYS